MIRTIRTISRTTREEDKARQEERAGMNHGGWGMKGCGAVREKRCGGDDENIAARSEFRDEATTRGETGEGIRRFLSVSLAPFSAHFPKLASKGNLIYAIL